MQPPTSPRLPGVPLLGLDATGPEYSRWKRSVRFALAQKDTWKYCNGSCPMPMPKARSASPTREEINDAQPSLLDERRAWMRQDREVKLDIFLSLAEDVMEDLFDVGQPLPPTKYTAQQILEALDARFLVFDFQGYHHAFCHFLNLNIDQFASLEEFNVEFTTVLEDLLDYGQPLSNAQACSAYFSKLGCIENPWIAKKISEWDANSRGFLIRNLMHEAVFCSNIKPRATMAPQSCYVKPAEQEQQNEVAELDAAPELSDISTLSSGNSHSRQISREVSERQKARANRLSNDPVDPKALHEALEQVPVIVDSQTLRVDEWVREESVTPEWLCAKENSVPEPKPEHLPFDRALPLLPSAPLQTPQTKSRPLRTASSLTSLDPTVPARLPKTGSVDGNMPVTPPLRVRPRAPTYSSVAPSLSGNSDIHPALRPATPPAKALETKTPSSAGPATSHPPIPERNPRRPRARSLGPSSAFRDTTTVPCSGPAPTTRVSRTDSAVYAPTSGSSESSSENSSENSSDVTLPLQGTDDPFWNWDSARPTSPITPLASLTLMQNPVLNIPCTPTPTRREFKAQVDDEVRWSPPPWILASFSPHLVRHSRVEPGQEEQQQQEEEEHPLPELRHKKSKTLPLLPSSDTPRESRPPHSLRHSFHVPVSAFSSLHFSNPSTPQSSKKRKSHLNHESAHASSCVTAETPAVSSSPGSGGMWRIPHRVHISSQLQTKGRSNPTPVQVQARRRDSVSKKTSNKKERVWSLGAHIGKFGVDGGKGLMKRRSGTLGKEVGVSS